MRQAVQPRSSMELPDDEPPLAAHSCPLAVGSFVMPDAQPPFNGPTGSVAPEPEDAVRTCEHVRGVSDPSPHRSRDSSLPAIDEAAPSQNSHIDESSRALSTSGNTDASSRVAQRAAPEDAEAHTASVLLGPHDVQADGRSGSGPSIRDTSEIGREGVSLESSAMVEAVDVSTASSPRQSSAAALHTECGAQQASCETAPTSDRVSGSSDAARTTPVITDAPPQVGGARRVAARHSTRGSSEELAVVDARAGDPSITSASAFLPRPPPADGQLAAPASDSERSASPAPPEAEASTERDSASAPDSMAEVATLSDLSLPSLLGRRTPRSTGGSDPAEAPFAASNCTPLIGRHAGAASAAARWLRRSGAVPGPAAEATRRSGSARSSSTPSFRSASADGASAAAEPSAPASTLPELQQIAVALESRSSGAGSPRASQRSDTAVAERAPEAQGADAAALGPSNARKNVRIALPTDHREGGEQSHSTEDRRNGAEDWPEGRTSSAGAPVQNAMEGIAAMLPPAASAETLAACMLALPEQEQLSVRWDVLHLALATKLDM